MAGSNNSNVSREEQSNRYQHLVKEFDKLRSNYNEDLNQLRKNYEAKFDVVLDSIADTVKKKK